jgi:hypothetical protein
MFKLLILLFLLVASVSTFCPTLNDADSFYCYTDGNQYEPDQSCGTAYYCNYDSSTSISKWAFGNNWGSVPNSWSSVYGTPTIDIVSCRGMTVVSLHKPHGSIQDIATAYDANLDMQIWVTADRVPAFNTSDIAAECDV